MRRSTPVALVVALALAVCSAGAAFAADPIYLVFFPEAPVALYTGGVDDLAATNPKARGERRLDIQAPATQAYLGFLDQRQAAYRSAIEAGIGRDLEVIFTYRLAGNGIATRMSATEAAIARQVAGVTHVVRDYDMPLDTDRGPVFIGAPAIWDGTFTGLPTAGEGTVVGVIDSGVNIGHDSFADNPVDGHVFENPLGAGESVGWCNPTHPNWQPEYICNDKLIGAWDFVDETGLEATGPIDDDGHGSHTASTAAGNFVDHSGDGIPDISGVAPHANVITYDSCYVDPSGLGLCPFSATSQSVEQAIADGVVDSINYSISGGGSPWSPFDIDSFFLSATAAGIYCAASAGNSGPGAGTVAHLGPWTSTTAASTHDRVTYENDLVDMSGGDAAPADLAGLSQSSGYTGPVVYAGDFSNGDVNPEQCLNPFPAGTFSGEIVLCDRGTIARVLKGNNVLLGGAGGLILADVDGTGPVADAHALPAIHVDQTNGDVLRAWLASGSGHTATITDSEIVLDPAAGDLMASFSSRGPNNTFDVLKPDLSGPGVNIFAAVASNFFQEGWLGVDLFFLSGTSMSSPHNAGSSALLKSLRPDWTPGQIKSALMTTANAFLLKEDGITQTDSFDVGAGRLNLRRAGNAGLLVDDTEANYLAADPALGGMPETLNVASFQSNDCNGSCSWTRTVTGSASAAVSWTAFGQGPAWLAISVDPASFDLAPGAEQEITVTATVLPGAPMGSWEFAGVRFTPNVATVPPARMPMAIVPTGEGGFSPSLSVAGACPGDLDVDVSGATPGSVVSLFVSTGAGSFELPAGRCAGTTVDLAGPARQIGRFAVAADGTVSTVYSAATPACGGSMQAIDLANCATSNVESLAPQSAPVSSPRVD